MQDVRDQRAGGEALSGWEQLLEERLPLFGHRNWIVVADAAYPAQCRPGIETICPAKASRLCV